TTVIPGFGAEGFRATRADGQGRFAFSSVPPGQYTLLARAGVPPRPTGRAAAGAPATRQQPPLWAQADVSVDGQDLAGIALTMQMGMTISGRVRFYGSSPSPELTRLRVSLTAVQTQNEATLTVSPAPVDADGRFRLTGVAPGRYRLTSAVPGQKPDEGWVLRSAVVNGNDTLDHPLELGANQQVTDAVLTFTDRPSEVSGLVQNAAGEPISDYFIIAFASDPASWVPQSRRIASTRPSADGRYLIRNLPPGDYRIAAVFDVEPGEWYDPSFLQQLVPTSLGVSLAEGEKKTQHLRLGVDREP
ncbi:MAG TPA: carboxypeptidase-like regulatory domain-containing protein, partial [Vicinamibacterales bacterium]|nr:carboxypeptidase-like regulatory domain-containing protein [Vicinamibacterales bacterium]